MRLGFGDRGLGFGGRVCGRQCLQHLGFWPVLASGAGCLSRVWDQGLRVWG